MAKKRLTENEIARRHVAIREQREQELKDNPTRDLAGLVEQMRKMRDHLDALPDDQEFTEEALADLDDCRSQCYSLKLACEAILESKT